MKWRIVTGKHPEKYDVEAETHGNGGWRSVERDLPTQSAARLKVMELQREFASAKLWFPGVVIEEFEDE